MKSNPAFRAPSSWSLSAFTSQSGEMLPAVASTSQSEARRRLLAGSGFCLSLLIATSFAITIIQEELNPRFAGMSGEV
jgi:hypothetical protein